MALPPLLAGAVQLTVAEALAAVAVTAVGAPGTDPLPAGVTGLDGAEAGPSFRLFWAITVNVYVVPFVRPVTVVLKVDPFGVVVITFPGLEVTT
jgi:hypothetical protein